MWVAEWSVCAMVPGHTGTDNSRFRLRKGNDAIHWLRSPKISSSCLFSTVTKMWRMLKKTIGPDLLICFIVCLAVGLSAQSILWKSKPKSLGESAQAEFLSCVWGLKFFSTFGKLWISFLKTVCIYCCCQTKPTASDVWDLFAACHMGSLHLHIWHHRCGICLPHRESVFSQIVISHSNLARHLISNIAGKISHINLQLII